jgi:Mrp family chromosome partitioning ATPase
MQEDTGSVTQKYAYNGALSRYLAGTSVEKDAQSALAATVGEERLVSSTTSATGKDAFQMTEDRTEKMASVIPDVHSSNAARQEPQTLPVPWEGTGGQELLLAGAKPSIKAPFPPGIETPLPPSLPTPAHPIGVPQKPGTGAKRSEGAKRDTANAAMVQEQCRHLCISLFLRERSPVRSLGFTSSLRGEGKSFLAMITARMLAKDNNAPVTLLECDWAHPCLHEHFGFGQTPGLAEWLRGECSEMAIRHEVGNNLTVIPAGNGQENAVKLLQRMRQKPVADLFGHSDELLVVDLPAIIPSAYGVLAADLVESLVVVVRAGVTPGSLVRETCVQLKDAQVHGLLLNQMRSQVPRWIRKIM